MVGHRSIVLVFVLTISRCVSAGPAAGWYDSFEAAEAVSTEQLVPMIVHFHAPWCGPCRQMDRTVFSTAEVQRALQSGLVAVKVDTSQRADLKARFGADTIPRDIVVYPDGSVETLSVGMVPAASYLALLRDTAARGRSVAMSLMDQLEAEEEAAARREAPVRDSVVRVDQPADEDEILGLNGYCPVRLVGNRDWVAGRPEISERYRGVLYLFSGQAEREQFLEQPDRFAPRNLGCDPVVLFREQRAVTGRIRFGAFFDGKLYLFRSADSRREFRRNPLRYTRIQHAVKPSELTGQTFR